jgi:hypothetical protein
MGLRSFVASLGQSADRLSPSERRLDERKRFAVIRILVRWLLGRIRNWFCAERRVSRWAGRPLPLSSSFRRQPKISSRNDSRLGRIGQVVPIDVDNSPSSSF